MTPRRLPRTVFKFLAAATLANCCITPLQAAPPALPEPAACGPLFPPQFAPALAPRALGPPAVVPPPVCDGGDSHAPARPRGQYDISGLSAGDTVARYRPADGPPTTTEHAASVSGIAVSNRACIYTPRFGAVRQVVRLHEETLPVGPSGVTAESSVTSDTALQPVGRTAQWENLQAARRSDGGLAVEERSGPLGVATADLPNESFGQAHVAERAAEAQPESARRGQRLAEAVGFDIPTTWTRLTSANAVINDQAADVVSASQGTATLRVESPGRAELTLCKRAGSDSARVGEELDFTIAFLNSGDVPLTDVVIVDALPARLQLVESSPATSLPAEISFSTAADGSRVISWTLQNTLDAGETGFVRLRTVVR
jgi:uncharacterized repeat protein (TIGR01451 family)